MELIRKMVLLMEEDPSGWAPDMNIEGYSPDQIGYHAYLLVDSGLATGSDVTPIGSSMPVYILNHLTSSGHDFADSARTQYIWDEVMEDMQKKGVVSAALDLVRKLLDTRIKKHLNAE
ncbi:DUF2513 domain-containing protein [Tautonia marina]|uniref:DUF2513 domain-containing protein n=1 Tax=Tautonia marina TaxID=2653855 RepID=UPI001376218D|nr:DUF2513 domain-containing protein [Tautonia marina]